MQRLLKKLPPVSRVLIVSTLIALFLRGFILEIYRIRSNSMYPTIPQDSLVLASRAAYNIHLPFTNFPVVSVSAPSRSDVVAFSLPESPGTTFVKRVVAIGGDRLEIRNGELWINDVALEYKKVEGTELYTEVLPSTFRYRVTLDTTQNYGPIDVPEGHFFALGDNREKSFDSRDWGPIPYRYLKGGVSLLWGT